MGQGRELTGSLQPVPGLPVAALRCSLLPSLSPALGLAVVGSAWVAEETSSSLDVEWENPAAEVDYYKLQYGPMTGQEVAEVAVPKSRDPKSRYDIKGKTQGWGCVMCAVGAEVGHCVQRGLPCPPLKCTEGTGALGIT